MRKVLLFTILIASIMLSGSVYSQNSIPRSLPIEKKTNYYLYQNIECREVVKSRNNTIDSLKQVLKLKDNAISLSKSGTSASIRVSSNLRDTITSKNEVISDLNKSVAKQTRRKNFFKKWSILSTAVAVVEAAIIYIKINPIL